MFAVLSSSMELGHPAPRMLEELIQTTSEVEQNCAKI
jgi:hypothetical protein